MRRLLFKIRLFGYGIACNLSVQNVQVSFINLIPMHFFLSNYIPPIVFQLQLQDNQSQKGLTSSTRAYPQTLLRLSNMFVLEYTAKNEIYGVPNLP